MHYNKLCVIYNTAPRYREAIFRAIDTEYNCDWYFGHTKSDIKEMNVSFLKSVTYYKTIGNAQKWYFKWGTIRLLFKKKYQTFFIIPATRSITDWLFFWLAFTLFPHKRIYLWTHGWYGKESGREGKMKLWLYRHATGIFCYGNYACSLLEKEGIDRNKLFTIHNSLDYNQQLELRKNIVPSNLYKNYFGNNYPVLIFIGRLTKVKQLDMLIDAVAELGNNHEFYNLVFVGDGSEKQTLMNRVENLNIKKQVWFYGACYDENVNAELLYNADICVAPGNIGLTAMHAMVFGTPCITHNDYKWQMPEFEAIKVGETGAFFERNSVHSLSNSIREWFANKKNSREEVRQACYKEIDRNWNPYYQMKQIKKHLVLK